VPVLVAVALGGFAVVSSLRTAQSFQRVQQLAVLSGDATDLAQALQVEREDTVTFIVMANQGGRASALSAKPAAAAPELTLLKADYNATGRAAAKVRILAATIGGSYPAVAQTQAQGAITAINGLPVLRQAATHSKLPVLTVINDYDATITQLLTLEDEVAAGSNDASLADEVLVTNLVSSMKEEASEQQAIVTSALRPDLVVATQLSAESLSVLNQQAAEQAADLSRFNLLATPAQLQIYDSELSSSLAATAQQQLQQASSLLESNTIAPTDPTFEVAASDASFITSSLGAVEQRLMSSIIAQSGSLSAGAARTALIEGLGVFLLLVLALLLIAVVGQSMTGPLRRLRAGALEVAGVRLPEAVRTMAESDGEGVSLDVQPIGVNSADEIGEVARAFDQVHREALRLAANEAALRGNVNAMFVNLSRRSQSLVERQIRLISQLEQGEQDSKRLASLFQMDHLATRMRRNSENLLVLAGHDLARRWNRPVALVDVLRAALSEIERYERVTLNVQPGVAVRAQAVSDVVHLTAELVENATSFSAAESLVTIAAHLLGSGGVLLEITDQGVGMDAEEMGHANWRLDNPPTVDVAVSRRMGLFVVGRLAARHGIKVRLRPAAAGGLVALVWLPDETITNQTPGTPGTPRRGQAEPEDSLAGPAGGGTGAGVPERGRATVGQEVSAARTPRFVPLRAGQDLVDSGPLRTTGEVAWPDSAPAVTTGPLAAFRDTRPSAAKLEADVAAPPAGQPISDGRAVPRSPSGVIEPPAADVAEQNRLPIFESVESDWFRHGQRTVGTAAQEPAVGSGWSSPADDGWRAAEVVSSPSSSGMTPAGLPKRVPQANLVPGTVPDPAAGQSAPVVVPVRSAAATRDRLASYQRGVRRGRSEASGAGSDGGEGETPR